MFYFCKVKHKDAVISIDEIKDGLKDNTYMFN